MKGIYAAIFEMDEEKSIEIGALGKFDFQSGMYVYVGSAMNSVEKRLERHFSDVENLHWHVDYFSKHSRPVDYFILPESSEYECVLADILRKIGEPVTDFGSSDCDCRAHLFRIPFQIDSYEDKGN